MNKPASSDADAIEKAGSRRVDAGPDPICAADHVRNRRPGQAILREPDPLRQHSDSGLSRSPSMGTRSRAWCRRAAATLVVRARDSCPGVSPYTQMGINGNLSFAYKFLKLAKVGKIADFSFKLGSASARRPDGELGPAGVLQRNSAARHLMDSRLDAFQAGGAGPRVRLSEFAIVGLQAARRRPVSPWTPRNSAS